MKVWLLDSFVLVKTLIGHDGYISDMCFIEEFLVSAATDGSLKLWSIPDFKMRCSLKAPKSVQMLRFIKVNQNKLKIAASCVDSSIIIWDIIFENDLAVTEVVSKSQSFQSDNSSIEFFEMSSDLRSLLVCNRQETLLTSMDTLSEIHAVGIDTEFAHAHYCKTRNLWMIMTKTGDLYFLDHLNTTLPKKVWSFQSPIEYFDLSHDRYGIFAAPGSPIVKVFDLFDFYEIELKLPEHIDRCFNSNVEELSILSTKNNFLKVSYNGKFGLTLVPKTIREYGSAAILEEISLSIISDDSGRYKVYSNNFDGYLTTPQSQFFDFEYDNIIFDSQGYAVSVSKQKRIENIECETCVPINLEYINKLFIPTAGKRSRPRISNTAEIQRSAEKLDNVWTIISCDKIYYPQLYDRVVIVVPWVKSAATMSAYASSLLENQPILQQTSNRYLHGVITSISYERDVFSEASVAMVLDITIVLDLNALQEGEIPISKNHIRICYSTEKDIVKDCLVLYEIFRRLLDRSPGRGHVVYHSTSNKSNQKLIVLGKSREVQDDMVKVRRVDDNSVMVISKFSVHDTEFSFTNFMDALLIEKSKTLGKKLRALMKTTRYQKSINIIDYTIEGKNDSSVQLIYPVTFSTILQRLEGSFYRRLDALLFDIDSYSQNLRYFQETLETMAHEEVNEFKLLAKNHFNPRNKR